MRPFLFFAIVAGAFVGRIAAAEPQRFASGPNHVTLVELYTSEGCSSCPPAERWIAARKGDAGLWRDCVPVAFHVDYWNQLGWPDRFSTREFTQRQYALSSAWGGDSVYTPCFVRDGAEWQERGARELRPSTAPAGVLAVTLEGSMVRAEFTPAVDSSRRKGRDDFEIHVALLGGGLASKVTAGENSGETLRQEFVALILVSHPLAVTTPDGGAVQRAEFALPTPAVKDASPRALAAWITRHGKFESIQATGGWLK
jgi:hypothetical protein